MLRVIHTADTHIGYRQYHADERRQDFLDAFEQVIDDAIEAGVDAVVHAGDLFHDKRPDLRDLQGTIAALARLRAAAIPFLAIVGNHERKRDTQWLDLFADLGLATRLGSTPTIIEGVALYGIDYLTPATRRADAVTLEPTDDADVSVLVGHGIIEGLPYGDWDLDAVLKAVSVDIHAVLLGDYHEHELEQRDGIVITYAGSTERASSTERAPRGYNLVTVDDREVSVSHRTLPETRPFRFIDITLGTEETERHVLDRIEEYDLDDAVAIVTIDGDGEPVSPASVEAAARDRGALVARVNDRRDGVSGVMGETGVSVSFADPDRAIREAMVDVELSEAAYRLDELVRDRAVPESRVRDKARSVIETLLAEDPESITRPAELGDELDEQEAEDVAERADDELVHTAEDDQRVGDSAASSSTQSPHDEDELSDQTDDREEMVAATDGQASMEDYL